MYRYSWLLLLCGWVACQSPATVQTEHEYTNHLINENSPYLLQHAHNPVDWYPWGEEALAKAKAENKLLLISVGYSACHWCHVMEHESFEDTTVARIMNENFVNIKVDREERPDVDDVYMTACQLASGRGCGWPLNAFALPDGRPVWAGTYFPKKQWVEVMEYFIKIYQEEPNKLQEYAAQLIGGIASANQLDPAGEDVTFRAEVVNKLAESLLDGMDMEKGGRQGAPKFPMPVNQEFLLAWHHYSGNEQALRAVTTTLDNMARGGIYDQLAGGFARYSVDDRWQVPHFEKMLYDNGQLVSLYAKAYQVTGEPRYQRVVEETLAFIEHDLTDATGGFYSSLDADSEGEEGLYYVWHSDEIDSLVTDPTVRQLLRDYYQITAKGNWEEHKNVLYSKTPLAELATRYDLTEAAAREQLAVAKKALLAARTQRIAPGKDDKILTSWNALMLQGYLDAYRAFGEGRYRDIALRNAEFLLDNLRRDDGGLWRNYKDGKAKINGFLDDYALLGQALLSLYEVTFDTRWLDESQALADYAIAHFYDEGSGLFYYTSDLDPPLITRQQDWEDNVIPSSNAVAARWLHRLGTYLYQPAYLAKAERAVQAISSSMDKAENVSALGFWAQLYLDQVRVPYEVAIVGPGFGEKRAVMQRTYQPHAIYLGGSEEGELELLQNKLVEDETMIYVCQNKVCKLPVTDPAQALDLMK